MSHEDTGNWVRRTKIVSTVGPACQKYETIEALIKSGVNVFRLNFSFGNYGDMGQFIKWIRDASAKLNVPVGILGDLQGPKFRTGEQETETIDLKEGEKIRLKYAAKKSGAKGTHELIFCPHEDLMTALQVGGRILIYDGAMELRVAQKVSAEEVVCEIRRGGQLRAHKGLNVPDANIKFSDLLPKDKEDAAWMLQQQQFDYVGQSFVQTAHDVRLLRAYWQSIAKPGQRLPLIIAKIEKPQALKDIDAVLQEADGVMVARGDLGVELSLEMVPIAQKLIIQKANAVHKPVITATQMLQSMTTEEVPTRAEVSDVANAVFDGTDAVMTSQETSMSPHPTLVVSTMANIVRCAEMHLEKLQPRHTHVLDTLDSFNDAQLRMAVAQAALDAAHKSCARALLVFGGTNEMARTVSKGRPFCPVVAITQQPERVQELCLFYALYPVLLPLGQYTDPTLSAAESLILEHRLAGLSHGDRVVLCSGAMPELPALAYTTKIYTFGAFLEYYTSKWRGQVGTKKQQQQEQEEKPSDATKREVGK